MTEVNNSPAPATKSKRTRRWSMIAGVVIAVFFLYIAFKDVDWNAMWNTIRTGRYELIILVALCSSGNLFLRSMRWRLLLSAEKPISKLTVFWATCAGYFGNQFLPARAGELIRSAAVGQAADIGMSYSLATAVTERIMDAILLVLISLTAIFTLNNIPVILVNATRSMAILGLVGLVGIIMAPKLESQIKWCVNKFPIPLKFKDLLNNFLERFLLGMRALQNPTRLFGFLGFSIVIWSIDAGSAILIGQAFNLSISIALAFIILAALGLSSAIPSTPGYVGVYQVVALAVMTPFGFKNSDILVYIVAWQALTFLSITIWGAISFWQLGLGKKSIPAVTTD